MVLLWMILLEVLLCAEAENVTEVRGQLGAEVTLTCSSGSSDPHWYMEIYSQLRAGIGRSLSSVPSYHSPDFETKFSILGNILMIKNLTAEDCRLYYCGIRRDDSIQFVETFHLVSDQQSSRNVLQSDGVVFSSGPERCVSGNLSELCLSVSEEENQQVSGKPPSSWDQPGGSTVRGDPAPPSLCCSYYRVHLLQCSASSLHPASTLTDTPAQVDDMDEALI